MDTLASRYDATATESFWYARWEAAGLFSPSSDPAQPKYSITIPPPNITGSLHMGHALCYPLQDLYGRYKRLRGYDVLVLPGQDHAGIATQSVVDRVLRNEGTSAAQLGRDAFVERVWKWRADSGNTISNQLRALGCAFDWSRSRFTLDEGYAKAVQGVFIDWFERGIIYRGKRVVNWDPSLRTSVSDIETERQTVQGSLYHIRYPLSDGSGHVTIATTRPETMLADVAVAVHPSDSRYTHLVGRSVTLPLMDREIPIIADIYPDPDFGTGAVKITPAHDPNDFEVGRRHNLPMPVLLDETGHVAAEGGRYAGLERFEARKQVIADLEQLGLLEKVEPHEIAILVSDRSKQIIEPLLSEQWFAKQAPLAQAAIRALEEGRIRVVPERFQRVLLDWLENLQDWCVGRQLWWGHRIPVYYDAEGRAYAARSWDEAQQKASAPIVRQDEDVLDTWFSSGLWPFATLGWPDESEELATRFPTDLLITDRNILYLWVARMAMMSLDLVDDIPFRDVFIFATVLTDDGRRMSKSLGTGVDPMTIIEKSGADALRFTLLGQAGQNQELRYSDRKTDDSRNFCNKIWNASRFVLMHLQGEAASVPSHLEPEDRWLLSKLAKLEQEVRTAYESYDVQRAAQGLHQFFWADYCDWYIELAKSRLASSETKTAPLYVLSEGLRVFLPLMHPIMPHITEEIYHRLPLDSKSEFLMSSNWPVIPTNWLDEESERRVEKWMGVIRAARALRAELGLSAMRTAPELYIEGDLGDGEAALASQAWFAIVKHGVPPSKHISTTAEGVDIHLPVEGNLSVDKELARLAKEEEKIRADLSKVAARLENPMFTGRAKPEVVEKERLNLASLEDGLRKLEERRRLLES